MTPLQLDIARVVGEVARAEHRRRPWLDKRDLEQDAWVSALEKLPRFEPSRGTLGAFVSTVVRRDLIDRGRRATEEPADVEDRLVEERTPEDSVALSEIRALLRERLARFGPPEIVEGMFAERDDAHLTNAERCARRRLLAQARADKNLQALVD